jgi:hypothetical protein
MLTKVRDQFTPSVLQLKWYNPHIFFHKSIIFGYCWYVRQNYVQADVSGLLVTERLYEGYQ